MGAPTNAKQQDTPPVPDEKYTVASLLNPMLENDVASHVTQGLHSRSQLSRATSECSLPPKVDAKQPPLMDVVLGTMGNERATLQHERGLHQERRRSRRLRSAGSMASGASSCSSSCWSQAVRSTVLDLELDLERQRREEAEKELVALRAQLAKLD